MQYRSLKYACTVHRGLFVITTWYEVSMLERVIYIFATGLTQQKDVSLHLLNHSCKHINTIIVEIFNRCFKKNCHSFKYHWSWSTIPHSAPHFHGIYSDIFSTVINTQKSNSVRDTTLKFSSNYLNHWH